MIVGITGKAQHGKDTAGQVFMNHGFLRIAFADKLKEIVNSSDMVSEEDIISKSDHYRSVLQAVGHMARELVDPDFWIKKVWSDPDIIAHLSAGSNIIVTDIRYPNEADHILRSGGYVIRVVRVDSHGKTEIMLPGSRANFPSEISMDEYPDVDAEFRIRSGDLEALEVEIEEWLVSIRDSD